MRYENYSDFGDNVSGKLAVSPDQPFYRIFALGEDGGFVAYAAESVLEDGRSALLTDEVRRWFTVDERGHHAPLHAGIH